MAAFMNTRLLLPLFTFVGTAPTMLAQTFTFAQFRQTQQFDKLLTFDNNDIVGPGAAAFFRTADTTTGIDVNFQFNSSLVFTGDLADLNNPQAAKFVMNSWTHDSVSGSAPFLTQQIDGGSLEFRRATPIDGKDLLLKVTFSGAFLITFNTTGAEFASESGSTITYSSDFLTFNNVVQDNWSIALSGITPPSSTAPNGLLTDFVAAGTGTFDSSAAPIPEPNAFAVVTALVALAAVSCARERITRSLAPR